MHVGLYGWKKWILNRFQFQRDPRLLAIFWTSFGSFGSAGSAFGLQLLESIPTQCQNKLIPVVSRISMWFYHENVMCISISISLSIYLSIYIYIYPVYHYVCRWESWWQCVGIGCVPCLNHPMLADHHCNCYTTQISNDRRKFRSQTSDNMDRWKAE